jgi:hypothetical protein
MHMIVRIPENIEADLSVEERLRLVEAELVRSLPREATLSPVQTPYRRLDEGSQLDFLLSSFVDVRRLRFAAEYTT